MSEHRIQCNGDSVPGAPNCGIVTLTAEQYTWNLSKPNYPWCCPNCGSTAEYVEPEEYEDDYHEDVGAALGDEVICPCGATLETYADRCSAGLADPCPGFLVIEGIRKPQQP